MAYVFPFNALSKYQFEHMDEPLLLPDDVLSLISALSKPFPLRYPKTYKKILKKLQIDRWPELMRELSFVGEPKELLHSIRYYVQSRKNCFKVGLMYKVGDDFELVDMVVAVSDATTGVTPVLGHVYDYRFDSCLDVVPVNEVP